MKPETRLRIVRLLLLLLVIALSVSIYLYRDQVKQLAALGYPGLFLVSLLTNATLILPVPGVLFTSLMGAVFHPFWVALVAGTGSALGELSGYLAGISGRGVVERSELHDRLVYWMRRYGVWTVLVLAFVPNPIFDVAGIIAGMLKMPVWRFLLFCWIGKVLKMLMFAYGGAGLLNFLPF
ncbi:YqaA family protein [Anaerolinea thermophila]|uniref:Hypothetical membrane protein n=1 Tax=Anaerolinea thermophila (strain DSM 14523 / JCM 11388 / NBRC 100420 / UNI-1) TaxID=926569 RepID=E8N6D2_ANATU|nr:VTT domain-containing protein [Anaerolinea thermophila]BAJ63996.1 hypothetical membrane protein [Anaerolinea thermophila UNI-1]